MKIEKVQPSFEPVQITLETQEEVWDLLASFARVIAEESYTDIHWQLFCALGGGAELAKSGLTYEGTVKIKRKV